MDLPEQAEHHPRISAAKLTYWALYWKLRRVLGWRHEAVAMLRFIVDRAIPLPRSQRARLMWQFVRISRHVPCVHTQAEMVAVARSVFKLPASLAATIVEAGCYRGGSAAKLSLCAALTGRELYLFDSFEGIPDNAEQQVSHGRKPVVFQQGAYAGSLTTVRTNIERYGAIEVCHFVRGWFSETMPHFGKPVGVAYVDVDLVSSTGDCLRHLYPLLVPGGAIYSQDAHLSGVVELLENERFWNDDVGGERPVMERVASPKLMRIDPPCRKRRPQSKPVPQNG